MSRNIAPSVAIVGATGAVGVEMLHCLERRNFKVRQLKLLASSRSVGKEYLFNGQTLRVEELTAASLRGVDIALFAAGGSISKEFAPEAAKSGCVVIDNSSAFRLRGDVPLVIPEVNPGAAKLHQGIIANPNCSTIIAMTPLWPVHQKNPIRRVICATYQSASGAGAAGMRELEESTRAYLAEQKFTPSVFPHHYAFNLFSHNSALELESGYNEEELKMTNETRKIFADPEMRISATCVRVPVLRAHTVALTFECVRPIDAAEVRGLMETAKGVKLVDERTRNYFPMPRDASHRDEILVGRIRQDISDPDGHSISLMMAGDQLLKGAALNAVQIAELI